MEPDIMGLLIDMATMEYKIRKFMFTRKRVIKLPFTPLDGYLNPHVPKILKRKI